MTPTVEAPRTPGSFVLVWDVVHEGELWVSSVDPTPVDGAAVEVVVGRAFSVVDGGGPRVMVVGGEAVVPIVVRNEGIRPWKAGEGLAVSYHWLDHRGSLIEREGNRAAVAMQVAPGETAEFPVVVVAPRSAGRYRLQWDMVEEGVCWFSDLTDEPLPSSPVLVATDVFADPGWWAVFSLLTAAVAVSVLGSRQRGIGGLVAGGSGRFLVRGVAGRQTRIGVGGRGRPHYRRRAGDDGGRRRRGRTGAVGVAGEVARLVVLAGCGGGHPRPVGRQRVSAFFS